MRIRLPWLHPQRAEVLSALALAVRLRQPLAEGFARLAAGDPLLRPWSTRLHRPLSDGTPLGQALWGQRLLSRQAAVALDEALDPLTEFTRLTNDSLQPLRGLWLIRWFPVVLSTALIIPFFLAKISGIATAFERIYRELGIGLPGMTEFMIAGSSSGLLVFAVTIVMIWLALVVISQLRILRHVRHLWWVEVHRQAAMLELIEAALAAEDEPRRLGWPWSWTAALRLTARRQRRPDWDLAWRTWRILTRWRAQSPNWKIAARATTAVELLQALAVLSPIADRHACLELRDLTRERLRHALAPAVDEAKGLLMVGLAAGMFLAVLAFFMPFIKVIEFLGM